MMKLSWIVTVLLCCAFTVVNAQPKKEVRKGNELYKEQKYDEASKQYSNALLKQPNYVPGLFNLGNTKYKQKNYDASRKVFEGTAKTATEKNDQAAAYYNIGNSYMEEKKWKEAVEAYKNALRRNPQDENAKYNLVYAMQMMKNQQGGGGDNKKNKDKKEDKKDEKNKDKKDEKKDENKDQQNQENKEDNKDKKEDQQQKDQQQKNKEDKKDEKEKRPQGQPSKLSEKQAEQLLNALQQEEKKLQDKMKKGKGVPVKVEKDW